MRKKYYKLGALALCVLAAPALKAQTYTSGDITAIAMPVMSHDSAVCSSNCMLMYDITITSSFTGDSVKIVDIGGSSLIYSATNTTGASPWTFSAPIPIFNPMITDDQVSGGIVNFFGPDVKIISGTDTISPIHNMYTLPVPNPCHYGSVSGLAYIDNNSDCMYNTGDVPVNAIPVSSNISLSSPSMSSTSTSAYTDGTGAYNMKVQESWMTSYNVSLPSAYYFIFPHTSCFSGSYTYTSLPQVNVDFPLQCTGLVDVQCYASTPPDVRVATPFVVHPWVSNTGCDPMSGELTLIKDSRTIYNASLSSYPATSVSGDTLRWNYTDLTNLTGGAYWNSFMAGIHLTPDTSVHIGDVLCFHVYTGIPSTDTDPANNDQTICLPVVYSYDPNAKEVSPRGSGVNGDIPASTSELTYTLHFQNTGTSMAYNVKVVDTLDASINAQSLRILGSSHTMTPEWLAPNVVRFTFNGIMLPDSLSNEPASHGSVRFKVKLNTGLPLGTQIKNKGYIYFDSNPAVITNTTRNTLSNVSAVPGVQVAVNVKVYPNPAGDYVHVDNLAYGSVYITDISGALVAQQQVSGNTAIDIHKLAPGVYILKAVSPAGTTVTKLIKE